MSQVQLTPASETRATAFRLSPPSVSRFGHVGPTLGNLKAAIGSAATRGKTHIIWESPMSRHPDIEAALNHAGYSFVHHGENCYWIYWA